MSEQDEAAELNDLALTTLRVDVDTMANPPSYTWEGMKAATLTGIEAGRKFEREQPALEENLREFFNTKYRYPSAGYGREWTLWCLEKQMVGDFVSEYRAAQTDPAPKPPAGTLQSLREATGRSLDNVAIALDWTLDYIAQLEAGECSFGCIKNAIQLAAFYELDISIIDAASVESCRLYKATS